MKTHKKTYLAIKYHKDFRNKHIIEKIDRALKNLSIDTSCIIRDFEQNSEIALPPGRLMQLTFEQIISCDMMIVDLTEKGVGLGIEAGFAYAHNIPIIVIARTGSDISATLCGIAKHIVFYGDINDIENQITCIIRNRL